MQTSDLRRDSLLRSIEVFNNLADEELSRGRLLCDKDLVASFDRRLDHVRNESNALIQSQADENRAMHDDLAKLKQELAVMKRGIAIQRHVFLTVFQLRSLTEASSEAPQTRGDSGAGREQGCHSDARQKFTTDVLEFYEASGTERQIVRCHLPAVEVPAAHAAAVCIFPRRCAAFLKGFTDLDDVDDPVNGLVLLKPLKAAFECGQVCFLWSASAQAWQLHILDDSVRRLSFGSVAEAYISKPESDMPALSPEVAQMTVGDVAGMSLTFYGAKRPNDDCLKFHCHTAVYLAQNRGWVPPGAEVQLLKDTDAGPNAVQELTMQLFWQSIEEQGVPSQDPSSVADSGSSWGATSAERSSSSPP